MLDVKLSTAAARTHLGKSAHGIMLRVTAAGLI
jgi:hypothetical protein